ncbi:MAG: hypothetical protein JNL73_12185 [Anaerolineales bacterium]|nr:hypothetical protein [Anaerolineales bacterium]
MKVSIRFRNVLLTSIAAGAGLLTLLGYFIPVPVLIAVRMQLVSWATLLAAVAVLIGAYSLVKAHVRNFMGFKAGGAYSLIAVLGFAAMVIAGIVTPVTGIPASAFLLDHVVIAGATALSALLLFVLVIAAARVLRRPISLTSVAFLVGLVISLIGLAPTLTGLPDLGFAAAAGWLAQVPAVAGGRGLLIGISLGVIATGLRVLLAIDRPYGD